MDIVIATGSVASSIPGFDFDGKHVWSSTEALAPDRIPDHLVVIGGGYIGLELGMLYRKLGSEVTVIEFTEGSAAGPRPRLRKDHRALDEKDGHQDAHQDGR